jgi:hypothetical protein
MPSEVIMARRQPSRTSLGEVPPAAHNPNHAVVPGDRLKLAAHYARKGGSSQQ